MPNYSGLWTSTQQMQAQNANLWASAPPTIGAAASFRSATTHIIKTNVWPLTTTKAIISFHDYTNDGLYAVIASISGTTITYGTPALIKSTFSPYGSAVVALDAATALIVYENNANNYLDARVLSISGTTITVGSAVANSEVSQYPSLAPLTSTTALCGYSGGKAVVISVSGTTPSFGSIADAAGGANSSVSVYALSSTAVVMIRDDNANSNNPTVNVMTISGTSITMGSNAVIDTGGVSASSGYVGIAATSSTSAIAVWKSAATGTYPKAVAMTISGTTPTFGTVITLGTNSDAGASANQSMAPISDSKAIFVLGTTGVQGGAYVLSRSGTTLSASELYLTVTPAGGLTYTGSGSSIAKLNGNIFINPYRVAQTRGDAQIIIT